jgi:hypothetical protein
VSVLGQHTCELSSSQEFFFYLVSKRDAGPPSSRLTALYIVQYLPTYKLPHIQSRSARGNGPQTSSFVVRLNMWWRIAKRHFFQSVKKDPTVIESSRGPVVPLIREKSRTRRGYYHSYNQRIIQATARNPVNQTTRPGASLTRTQQIRLYTAYFTYLGIVYCMPSYNCCNFVLPRLRQACSGARCCDSWDRPRLRIGKPQMVPQLRFSSCLSSRPRFFPSQYLPVPLPTCSPLVCHRSTNLDVYSRAIYCSRNPLVL